MYRLGFILLKDLLVLLFFELAVRAASGLGWVSLPSIGIGGFDRAMQGENAPLERRLYEPDRNLIFQMRPHVDIVYNRTAVYSGMRETFEVRTESHGFRTRPFSETKAPEVFRIVCLGDSSTFGFNVEAEDSYPQMLGRLLEETHPRRFEVLNLGVPGYTSRQGLELIRQRVLKYEPDVVVFAYGSNDRGWRRPFLDDDELIRLSQSATGGAMIALRGILDHYYTYRLLKRAMELIVPRFVDSSKVQVAERPRVSLEGIRDDIVTAHELLSDKGATLLVLNNDFSLTDAVRGIVMGAQATGDVYLDMQGAFVTARRERTRHLETTDRLPPVEAPPGMTVLRVKAPTHQNVVLEQFRILQEPLELPMHDDGQRGDQVAGDGIWSQAIPAGPGQVIIYKFGEKTPSGVVTEFRDEMPSATWRSEKLDGSFAGEIDTFGQVYLHSDRAHPDEEGHQLIAQKLLAQLFEMNKVKAFLQAR